jgi:hypothetical protein
MNCSKSKSKATAWASRAHSHSSLGNMLPLNFYFASFPSWFRLQAGLLKPALL